MKKPKKVNQYVSVGLHSIVVSIPVCHTGDRGSNPCGDEIFFFQLKMEIFHFRFLLLGVKHPGTSYKSTSGFSAMQPGLEKIGDLDAILFMQIRSRDPNPAI